MLFWEAESMKISEIFKPGETTLSLEVFPPKADSPIDVIYDTLAELSSLKPSFISVTYGAGGSMSNRTIEIASVIKSRYGIEPLAHLTCVGARRSDIDRQLDEMQAAGIENVLALRGDIPAGMDPANAFIDYQHGSDLVCHIALRKSFCIGVAAYPEVHFQSKSRAEDLKWLRHKVECGASFITTQLFFENEHYYRFVDNLRALDINIPVLAGIMPVLASQQILRMGSLSGCTIPAGITRLMARYKDPQDFEKAGLEYCCRQVEELVRNRVDGIHLYSMNKAAQTKQIVRSCFGDR
jgi:methylenetetrahydrofolate reductase (NADPH)